MPCTTKFDSTLLIVDPELRDYSGHYFHYDTALATEAVAREWNCTILAAQNYDKSLEINAHVIPTFTRSIWAGNPHPMWGNSVLQAPGMVLFFIELWRMLRNIRVGSETIFFFPTLLGKHILPIALLAAIYGNKCVLVLRYQSDYYWNSLLARIGFRLLREAVIKKQVCLVSDSHILASELSSMISLPLSVIPIPLVLSGESTAKKKDDTSTSAEAKLLRFSYLGDAREEKGIVELLEAIDRLPSSLDVEFVVQVNNPDSRAVREAIDQFRIKKRSNVILIESALSQNEYFDFLKSSDLVLLPYRSENYNARTSGLFAEAVAYGKPVLVAEGTWLSSCARLLGTGIVCPNTTPGAIVAAIIRARQDIEILTRKAEKTLAKWQHYNNPRRCLDAIIQSDFSPPAYFASPEFSEYGSPRDKVIIGREGG